jgi:hypothetical protein
MSPTLNIRITENYARVSMKNLTYQRWLSCKDVMFVTRFLVPTCDGHSDRPQKSCPLPHHQAGYTVKRLVMETGRQSNS